MKKFTFILLLFFIGILSCDREFEIELATPTIITSSVVNIETTTAQSGGRIEKTGGADITAKGVCWSTTNNPTIENSKTEDGTGDEEFTSNISGLLGSTTYYVRSYATNEVGTAYGQEKEITSLANPIPPTITTLEVSEITANSAQSGGNIESDGGSTISVKGVCWNTTGSPTLEDNTTENGSGDGDFTSIMSGLSPATTYYVRAFATNTIGTAYGEETSFTTDCDGLILYTGDLILTTQYAIDAFAYGCYYKITGFLKIEESNPGNIVDLTPLINISEVNGSVIIANNTTLENLDGLNNLTYSGGNVTISGNTTLANIDALNSITSIGSSLNIIGNTQLISLNELNNISSSIDALKILGNDALVSINGLNNLPSIDGNMEINNNAVLDSLNGLNNISSVYTLNIQSNDALVSINGFNNLSSIDGSMKISNNAVLAEINGFSILDSIELAFTFENNDAINDMSGFSNLTHIGFALQILNNDLLTSLDGLEAITSIGTTGMPYHSIINNTILTDLCGIRPILISTGEYGIELAIHDNAYNPTVEDIIDGNCSNE